MTEKMALEKLKNSDKLLDEAFINIQKWLNSNQMPRWSKDSIIELIISNAWEELNDRFYCSLAFGTGGMRGRTIGKTFTSIECDKKNGNIPLRPAVGINVLNDFTIIKGTIGLFNYTLKFLKDNGKIDIPRFIIAYDVRYFSKQFAELAASVWIKLGGQALIFEEARSTPQLSFSVRHYKAHCGAVITASHNPYHDNGFKVYFGDGAQVVDPHAGQIVELVNSVNLEDTLPYLEANLDGVIRLGSKADYEYKNLLKELLSFSIGEKNNLKVVFSPIHGTGGIIAVDLLREIGLDVLEVESQKLMDPAFSTVESPNPENASALKEALDLAYENEADLVIATDPDADRMGVAISDQDGSMHLLSGNQIGALLADYRIKMLKERNILPKEGSKNAVILKTLVTTRLQDAIAESEGLKVVNTLTGFKWIGKKLDQYESVMKEKYLEEEGIAIDYDKTEPDVRAEILMDYSNFFVFGGEESYGYLAHDVVRDKDANASALIFSEMAAYYKSKGKRVIDVLKNLYFKHGYFSEKMINIYYEGAAGSKKISKILESYRVSPPKSFGNIYVNKIHNYGEADYYDEDGLMIPKQNFYLIECTDEFSFAVRGSGTEPKIKFYIFGRKKIKNPASFNESKVQLESEINNLAELIKSDAQLRAE